MAKITIVWPVMLVLVFQFTGCTTEKENPTTLFTKLAADDTGIGFVNSNTEDDTHNILTYEYFYNGGGVALGDINNDGLTDIYFSANQEANKLYLNKGNFKFEDITDKAGVSAKSGWRTGVVMADVNGDGYLDIYVCRSGWEHEMYRVNSLYINNKDLTFTDKAEVYGLADDSFSTQASFMDYDNDGDLDMFLLNHSRLMISNSYDIRKRYNTKRVRYVGNKLYRNDGNKFTDVSDSLGIYGPASNYGLGITYADMNNDGWTDLYTSNDYTEKDKLLINSEGKFFTDISDSALTHMSQFSMGVDIADVNNDGLLDIFSVDMLPEENKRQKEFFWPDRYDVHAAMVKSRLHYQYMRNMLQLNNGDGTFSEIGQIAGISNTDWSWAPLFADYDNDGLQDLFVTNGFKRNFTSNDFLKYKADLMLKSREGKGVGKMSDVLREIPPTKVHNYMFRNETGMKFTDVSKAWGFGGEILSNGAAYGDLDNDGDLDVVTNAMDEEAGIYRNNSQNSGNHFLKVKLEGTGGNRFALGARVTVYHAGSSQTRVMCPVKGFQSSVEPNLFFGLGKTTKLDSIVTEWQGGGRQIVTAIKADQLFVIRQESPAKKLVKPANPARVFTVNSNIIDFKHSENDFIDFKVQGLLPRTYSTAGPAMAKSDINHDGFTDIYIGGAKGQQGSLFIQNKRGEYRKSDQPFIVNTGEETDALFFDMDNDGDEDLYIVNGGYEFDSVDKNLQDKLYSNDGDGNFKAVALPEMLSSGSCACTADIDADGDLDLFVGGRIVPGRYPETPVSYILLNDGTGKFTIETSTVAPALEHIGLVTDALWIDLNNDKAPELIVTGEWMPISIYSNEKGKLIDKTGQFISKKTNGWWNCLLKHDFDGDGDVDIVAGNFGMNNQFKPTPDRPVTLYYADYDNNGSIDPLMNYFIGEKSYPAMTRDELTDQVPSFKKRFTDYASYAETTIDKILDQKEMDRSKVLTAYRFESIYLENKGGSFAITPLPFQLQLSPVFAMAAMDVNADGKMDIIAGGNLSRMGARHGKAASTFGALLLGDGHGKFRFIPGLESGLNIRGDIRKILIDNNRAIIAVNDAKPVVLTRSARK